MEMSKLLRSISFQTEMCLLNSVSGSWWPIAKEESLVSSNVEDHPRPQYILLEEAAFDFRLVGA